jgi:tripartite-type tricarboxylate transporter receptor subunit TctC
MMGMEGHGSLSEESMTIKTGSEAMIRVSRLALAAALFCAPAAGALAQESAQRIWPSGPVRVFVGFAAGGTSDIIARDMASELEKVWRQPVIVDNRAGANGAIAAGQLAKLPADGQTLMMVVSGHVTNGYLNPRQPFDALKDFTPISLLASSPLVIIAHPGFPANDVRSMLELAREKPSTIAYTTPGTGSIQHLSMELLAYLSGARLVHVPYRSGALALNDTLAGHVPLSVLSVAQALPQLESGSVKPLAVTSAKATGLLPGVPPLVEAGLKDYEAELWFAVIAPAGLPPALAGRINADLVTIVKSPAMQKKLAEQGAPCDRQHAGRGRGLHEVGIGQVGQDHQGCEHQGGVSGVEALRQRSRLPAPEEICVGDRRMGLASLNPSCGGHGPSGHGSQAIPNSPRTKERPR